MAKIIGAKKPKRSEIFDIFSNKITTSKAISGLEHIDDLQMDLIIMMFDALLENETLTLSDEKLKKYNKMKDQWKKTKSVDFETETYEIDYAFNGNGENNTPNGLKRIARESQAEYKKILEKHGYNF